MSQEKKTKHEKNKFEIITKNINRLTGGSTVIYKTATYDWPYEILRDHIRETWERIDARVTAQR